jgi:hypothetical protein
MASKKRKKRKIADKLHFFINKHQQWAAAHVSDKRSRRTLVNALERILSGDLRDVSKPSRVAG